MANALLLIAVIGLIAISWFVFDFIVPFPQIGQLCTETFFFGKQCIQDPVSLASYPQRVLEWWIQKIATILVIAVVGFLAVIMLGSKKIW